MGPSQSTETTWFDDGGEQCPKCGTELFPETNHAGGLQCMDGGMYCSCPSYYYCNTCGWSELESTTEENNHGQESNHSRQRISWC